MKVLDFALQVGERGEGHYRKLADESRLPDVRRIFTMLAADQRELCRRLEEARGRAQGQVESANLDRVERPVRRAFARASGSGLGGAVEACRYALRVELRLVLLLERLAAREEEADAKRLLLMLADEERRLFREIEGVWDFLLTSRWYPSAIEYAMVLDRRGGATG